MTLYSVLFDQEEDNVSIVDLFSFFSLGVALSRGHGKFFFRGNVTVEEGRKFSLYTLCFADFRAGI